VHIQSSLVEFRYAELSGSASDVHSLRHNTPQSQHSLHSEYRPLWSFPSKKKQKKGKKQRRMGNNSEQHLQERCRSILDLRTDCLQTNQLFQAIQSYNPISADQIRLQELYKHVVLWGSIYQRVRVACLTHDSNTPQPLDPTFVSYTTPPTNISSRAGRGFLVPILVYSQVSNQI
jgi:hypothetical protein